MKKRIAAAVLSLCLCLNITACGENISSDSTAATTATTVTDAESTSQTTSETTVTTTEETTTTTEETTTTTTEETTTTTEETTTTSASSETTTTASSEQTQSQIQTQTEASTSKVSGESSNSSSESAATKASTTDQTTKATTKKPAPKVERITGSSPNLAFYKQRLFVMGDSVASGYAAYGRISYENSVAKVNVSSRTAGYQVPLAKAKNPSLVLTSMGMNDWGISTASFAAAYKTLLQNLRKALPKSVILVGAITPTAAVNQYPHVKPAIVKSHNAALKKLVSDFHDDKMIYFDAYSVVVGNDGVYMQQKYAAFDGLHLQPGAYDALLNAMSVVLDRNGGKDKITAKESGA